ncbi:MAG TPA: condensation domain-containing protein [Pseudonocardiaceae bacterium]|jgi:non-ribosomal peptide synthase protein (TIGR01720 family)|nr:condensation domain-containing protein [Pseudonocardiaceae bacterium]
MTTEPTDERIARLSPAKRALLDRWRAPGQLAGTPANGGTTPEEQLLLRLCAEALRADEVTVADSFIALGGDSITSLLVAAKATAAGFPLTSRQLLEAESLGQLVADLRRTKAASPAADRPTGPSELTPVQRWFFAQQFPDARQWHQTMVLELRARPEPDILAAALNQVVARHEVLSSAFVEDRGAWSQVVLDRAVEVELSVVSLGPDADDDTALRHTAEVVSRSADLAAGRLVAAVLLRGGGRSDRLLLAVHHLVVDGVSMRVLMADIEVVYQALRAGRTALLPPRTSSYRQWSGVLSRYAGSRAVAAELDYWRSVPAASAAALPVDVAGASNVVADRATVRTEVGPSVVSRLLRDVPRGSGFQVHHVVLAAMLLAWHRVFGSARLQADLESHGREPVDSSVDVSRTVGWFTTIYPVVFEQLAGAPLDVLRAVRDTLAKIPANGIGYGLLRYLTASGGTALADGPPSQLSFNYLGRFDRQPGEDALFGLPVGAPLVLQNERVQRPCLVDVVASIAGDTLLIQWDFSSRAYAGATIGRLVDAQVRAIGELVDLALAGVGRRVSVGLTDAQLASIHRQLGTSGARRPGD